MIAVAGDAVEVVYERVAELLHLWQSLPAQRSLSPDQDSPARPVPLAIEIKAFQAIDQVEEGTCRECDEHNGRRQDDRRG